MPPNGGIIRCKPKVVGAVMYKNTSYLLYQPSIVTFPVPCMYSWKSSAEGLFLCFACVAENASYWGISSMLYVKLKMVLTGVFPVLCMYS